MSGNAGSKAKILIIYDILKEHSDEEHPLTAAQIMTYLSTYGLTAERKAIYSDIDLLIDRGFDVIKNPAPSKGYYLGERDFQLAEVRTLIDAVQSAQFITENKTADLIKKIEGSLSTYQKDYIHLQQVYIDNRNKSENETGYYIIDAISTAIQSGKKLKLHYAKRIIEAGERPKNEDHIMTVSPYALVWSSDHYYLVCNHKSYDNLMHLRLDKITKPIIVYEEDVRPLSEVSKYKDGHFDASDYLSKTFNMFSGETERVKIRCNNSMWQVIADRFGDDLPIFEHTEDTFTIYVNAVTSGLTSWILQYADSMVVLEPKSVRDEVKAKIDAMQEAYK